MLLRRVFPLLVLAATSLLAQDMSVGRCNLSITGGSDKESFIQFDREFRAILSQQDATKIGLLVTYPLKVIEGARGTFSISDPATLQARYSEVFAPAVRTAALNQKVGEISCNFSGIRYGSGAGTVWVNAAPNGYGVTTVIVPGVTRPPTSSAVEATCNGERQRIVVELLPEGILRYRSWQKPRSILEDPDLEIGGGTTDVQGTGVCAARSWAFQDAASEFVLSGLGCWADSNPPPEGARGRLTITRDGETESSWCY